MMTSLFSSFDPLTLTPFNIFFLGSMALLCLVSTSVHSFVPSEKVFTAIQSQLSTDYDPNTPKSKNTPVFIFTLLCLVVGLTNFLGLGFSVFTITSHLAFTLALALSLWLVSVILMVEKSFQSVFIHLVPLGCPIILAPFMFLVESVSLFIRPVTLSVRLMANMVAGHLILTMVGEAISLTSVVCGGLLVSVALVVLEIAVAFIQSYVLIILCVLYLSES